MPYYVLMGGIFSSSLKYILWIHVLDYLGLLVSTNFMLLVFDSIKIIMKGVYPPNDYILKIDIGS